MSSLCVTVRPLRVTRPAVSVRVLLVAVTAVVAALLSGPAAAEPQRGLLVVQGLGGSSAELVVARRVQLRHPLPELSGGGEYAAVLLEPVQREPGRAGVLGAVQVRAFSDGTSQQVAPLDVEDELPAGRYRVTLLGQGPVRAAYDMADPNAPGLVLSPRTRITPQFFGRAERLPSGYSTARVELPGSVPSGRRVVQVGLTEGVSADDYRMCVTTGSGCARRVLPLCPSAVPCPAPEADLPRPRVTYQPSAVATLTAAGPAARSLVWSVQGYRQAPGRLRAAAIVF